MIDEAKINWSMVTAPASSWTQTADLRWVVPNVTNTEAPKLQQRWIDKISGAEEWRTVPMVVLSSGEFWSA